jgi:pimeloyl-ACP methyl ester carboxylesterase
MLLLGLLTVLAACQQAGVQPDPQLLLQAPEPEDFPLDDPYAATVIGTPPAQKVVLPRDVPTRARTLDLFPGRYVPEIFWYENGFRYTLALQSGQAPLVFIIPGTNAGPTNRYTVLLQQVLWTAGFHVAALPSTTFPNFMVTASSTGVPGRTSVDAADLYNAMQHVLAQVRAEVAVTDVSLVGYSLGGWQSAFVAELDSRRQAIGLRRTLLINPPVSLYRSSQVLDRMLTQNLPGGIDHLDDFIDRVLVRLTDVYQRAERVDFSQDFLFKAFAEMKPDRRDLAAIVGVAFRLSATNIAFTADVLSRFGYLVPPDRRLTIASSLTPYFDAGMRRGFEDYVDRLLVPFYRAVDHSLTREALIAEASLERIAPFLGSVQNVRLVTNADDVILAPGDIEFLRQTFGSRARIFPNGGHCGNLDDKTTVAAIVRSLIE